MSAAIRDHVRMTERGEPYYRRDLALVHHRGFDFHADLCAPGILALLEPLPARRGVVLELGCGSGLLTRHRIDAGHRVVATDASPAMLELARDHASGAEEITHLVLPDDAIPSADAIVSVGHVLNYLPDEASVDRALISAAEALRTKEYLARHSATWNGASSEKTLRPLAGSATTGRWRPSSRGRAPIASPDRSPSSSAMARARDLPAQGFMLLRAEGECIMELTLLLRPLAALSAFVSAMAALGAHRRSTQALSDARLAGGSDHAARPPSLLPPMPALGNRPRRP